ncbi:MAG TPA: polysaccharide biosynthesis tyrosine autokinase [Kiritimatiellia bacterium]|nr:polysaccharide biosynthesis tyrosine autokinase [Kiritimatiellia bacterium]
MSTENQTESTLHFLDYWRVIRSRKEIVLAVILLIVLTGAAYTLLLDPIYMARTTISVREDTLNLDVFDRQLGGFAFNPFFLRTEFERIQSKPILYQVINNLNLQARWSERYGGRDGAQMRREDVLRLLERSINVTQFRDTSFIEIQVFREGEEGRQEAAQIANEIASVYRERRLADKRNEVKVAIDAMENELMKQQEKVVEAENEVERIREELGVSLVGRGFRADNLRVQQMEADRISARVDMLTRKARWEQLTSLSGQELINASAYIVNDPSLVALRRTLVDSEVQLALLLENLGRNHPDVRRLMAGVDELKLQLERALDGLKVGVFSDYEVAKARYEALDTELDSLRREDIERQRERYLPFERASRNLLVQQEILNALRARVAQEGIKMEIPRTPVEIINLAEVPLRPVKPNLMLNLILSLVLGIGAGVSLAFFIEYLDTSVKTVDDVERFLGLPVLGVIPQKVRSLLEEGPESPHAEAYRVLRTNMQFAAKDMRGGAFSFGSGGVGEGKSTTLFNLAYICAQLGDRVLVIDSDLRRPVQHTFVDIPNRFGLTNILLQEASLEDAVKTTSVPNLDFLPSGKLPRNAVGLLDSERLRSLIQEAKKRYDFIFFDSPPIVGVSDASILASLMDGVFLVVQYRKYPRDISLRARRLLENVGANVIGVVLNNINIMRDDYYYYYHYSHGYYADESVAPEVAAADAARKKDVKQTQEIL